MGIPVGPINSDDPALDVYRSLRGRQRLPKWKSWTWTMFGQKKIKTEKGVRLTSYEWLGKAHISRIEYLGINYQQRVR